MSTSEQGRARGSASGPARPLSDAIDLWLRRVDTPQDAEALAELLDDVEVARAARFRFGRDRLRFVARRAFLREVLANYAAVAPARIRYRISSSGRPELDDPAGLTFSAAHSDGLAVVAVGRDRMVGVDVERVHHVPRLLELARDVCTPGEVARLRAVDAARRHEAFLRLWTRKESYVKALGAGLSMPLAELDVGGAGTGPRRLPGSDQPFVLADLAGLTGFVGAVAASGSSLSVRHAGAPAVAA